MHEQFEMKEVHRALLFRSRKYLLHNVRPTEEFWANLIAKDLFPSDMIDEIRVSVNFYTGLKYLNKCALEKLLYTCICENFGFSRLSTHIFR